MNKARFILSKIKKIIWLLQGLVLVSAVLYGVWIYRKKYVDDCFGEKY